jgi:hypothetical protein
MAESINYNVDQNLRIFGNEARPKSAESRPEQNKEPEKQQEEKKEKAAPEYKITSLEIEVPAAGLKENQPFDIKGTVQPLAGNITKRTVYIDIVAVYREKEDIIDRSVTADIDSDNAFIATAKQLHFHEDYVRAKRPSGEKFTLEIRASGPGAEAEFKSKPIELPMATKDALLEKGMYDETWGGVTKEPAKFPKNGERFVKGDKVKKLQKNLIGFRLLEQKGNTGNFDAKTETAVREFQALAKKPERKKASDTRVFKLEPDKVSFKDEPDGIVGPKTEKEIAVWVQNNWVKPDPEYRKGDFDEEGYQRDHGQKREDPHYHEGNQILDLQS